MVGANTLSETIGNSVEQSNQRQLRRLTSALLDNVLEPEDRDRLVSLLKGSQPARRVYLQNLAIESALQWEAASAEEATAAQTVHSPAEEKIVPWHRTVSENPFLTARNWLAGAAAAVLAFGLWVTGSLNRAPETSPEPSVAQDLQPINTEIQEVEGHTVASIYFRFDNEKDAPEG